MNPATGEVIGSCAMAGPKEAHAAIEAAKRAFRDPAWRTDRLLRARVLYRMAERFEERAGDLVELLGRENGKTIVRGGPSPTGRWPPAPSTGRRPAKHDRARVGRCRSE